MSDRRLLWVAGAGAAVACAALVCLAAGTLFQAPPALSRAQPAATPGTEARAKTRAELPASEPAPAAARRAGTAPLRVASLLPYVGDAVLRLPEGAARLVAGVARPGSTLPDGVADLGSPHAPNLEVLARARPDLVVGERRLHAALVAALGRAGGEVLLVDASSVDDTFAGLQQVADRLGAGAAMARRLAAARGELAALRQQATPHGGRPLDVLPLFGAPGAFLAITDATWLGDLLDRLGYRNLAAVQGMEKRGREAFPGYLQLSDEVLVTLRPRAVLLVAHGSPQEVADAFQRQTAGGAWQGLGKHARVLDPALFADNPGLDLPLAARRLVETASAAASTGVDSRGAGR